MAKEFFRDIATSIFKPVGDFISGGVTALQPGRAKQMQLAEEQHQADMQANRQKMEQFVKSERVQRQLARARKDSLDRGEGYYGGRGEDPYVKGSEDLGKIRAAKDKFLEEEMTPETAAYFDAAEKSVLGRMKSTPTKEYEAPTEYLRTKEVPEILGRKGTAGRTKPEVETSKSATEYFQPLEHDRFEDFLPPKPDEGMFDRLGDYFQAPTEVVPESNVKKSYPQMGISNVDDMATLEEMQKALPDVDMREEYEGDPELMKKIIELWKTKKLNKSNLHKAFSMIQQTAQQALGLA